MNSSTSAECLSIQLSAPVVRRGVIAFKVREGPATSAATAVAGGSGSGSNRSVGGNEPAQVQCTEF